MIFLTNLVSIIYLSTLIIVLICWNKNRNYNNSPTSEIISIIIPFRDEEKYLEATIFSVLSQVGGNFELIVINDHSTDNSLAIAKNLELKHDKLKVLSLTEAIGKKEAIDLGVNISNGNIIIQTDADCEMNSGWLATMRNNFTSNCRLLVGPVRVSSTSKNFNWLNQLEMMCLQALTYVSIDYGYPAMANGANLMYRKTDYLKYKKSGIGSTYESGDDQHILEYITKQDSKSVKYIKEEAAIVDTHFPTEWQEMVSQRARWGSKNKKNSGTSFIAGLSFFIIQAWFPLLLIFSVLIEKYILYAWSFLLTKIVLEFLLLFFTNQFFKTSSLRFSPLFSIVYPFFILNIAMKMNQQNKWKNRKIN